MTTTAVSPPYGCIVRRGEGERFEALAAGFAAEPSARIIWDHRQAGRQSLPWRTDLTERRTVDRRPGTTSSWQTLDFFVMAAGPPG